MNFRRRPYHPSPTHSALTATLLALALLGTPLLSAEYFVLADGGDDRHPGTRAQPFKTIEKAASIAVAGDTVSIGEGIYRETLAPRNSGLPGKPIRFIAAPGAKAVISGSAPITGVWSLHRDQIYKLSTTNKFIQLFVDGKMMIEARWPNVPVDDLMVMKRGVAGEGTGYEVLADGNLPPGDWNGAIVTLWPGAEWSSGTRHVTEYQPGKSLRFDKTMEQQKKDIYHSFDPYKPQAGNHYLLFGSLAGLDNPGEWFLDEKAGIVYLWAPDGRSPGQRRVEVKARDLACDLGGRSYIEIAGVEVFAAAISLVDATDCVIDGVRQRYVDHVREYDTQKAAADLNKVTGRRNTWRNSLIACAATTGLTMAGTGNTVSNCVIHDADYIGAFHGGLHLAGSRQALATHCTVFRTGRDAIFHSDSVAIRIEYNDVYAANLLNNDAGAIYCWGKGTSNGVIAWNWVHDSAHANAIYLDNFTTNFLVHHNLLWNCGGDAIHMNSPAQDNRVFNNTAVDFRAAVGYSAFSGFTPTMEGSRFANNLFLTAFDPKSPVMFVQGELGPSFASNGTLGSIDADGFPEPGSASIDAGIPIEGITDGYVGRAPDIGAYEFGGVKWLAGADFRDSEVAPLPAKNLKPTLLGVVTEQNMVQKGLALWLDASDAASVQLSPEGTVTAWKDRSANHYVAKPLKGNGSLRLVPGALGGKAVIRGDGSDSFRVNVLAHEAGVAGALTVFVVSQAPQASGANWQKLAACFSGGGHEWEKPNWQILRDHTAGKPKAYPASLFTFVERVQATLGMVSIMGGAISEVQNVPGDFAEVLLFDRPLNFEEMRAITDYLKRKWGLPAAP